MDVSRDARSASASEGATAMADETTTRRCIGSKRFGIEAHDAPVADFPKQPSPKDGLGRMCKIHWNQYTAGLARDAKARKAADAGDAAPTTGEDAGASPTPPEPLRKRRRPETVPTPEAGSEGDAG
jgi:hypothetical protein